MSTLPEWTAAAGPAGRPAEPPAAAPRARERRTRRRSSFRSLAASIGVHALLLLAAFAVRAPRLSGPTREAREYRLEVARVQPVELVPEEREPLPEPELPEEPPPPELVPQEAVAEEEPPEDALPRLDDSFALRDPLERVTETTWPDRSPAATPPPARVEPAPTPPPPAEATPAEAPREYVPVVLEGPAPSYPRVARRLGLQGSVRLRALVDRDGRVRSVEVVESSGHAVLDEAARDKLAEWLFRPWQPGEPEERSYLKTFTFEMPR